MSHTPESALRLARLALAALPWTKHVRHASPDPMVNVLSTFRVLSVDEMASELAALTKPIVCVGARDGAVIHIGYWVFDTDMRKQHESLRAQAVLPHELSRARLATRSIDSHIALLGGGAVDTVTWEELGALIKDYIFPLAAWTFKRSSRKLARNGCGVTAQMRLKAPSVLKITIPEEA